MQSMKLAVAKSQLPQMGQSWAQERVTNLISRVFGCWHREMSRPFSHHGQAYRVCLNCGAQRKFSLSNWKMQGDFYFNRPTTRLRAVAGAN